MEQKNIKKMLSFCVIQMIAMARLSEFSNQKDVIYSNLFSLSADYDNFDDFMEFIFSGKKDIELGNLISDLKRDMEKTLSVRKLLIDAADVVEGIYLDRDYPAPDFCGNWREAAGK